MDSDLDVYDELDETERALRAEAAVLKRTADSMRDAAREHDGKALGLLQAADLLRDIERPA